MNVVHAHVLGIGDDMIWSNVLDANSKQVYARYNRVTNIILTNEVNIYLPVSLSMYAKMVKVRYVIHQYVPGLYISIARDIPLIIQ